jgi:hypothetical protein
VYSRGVRRVVLVVSLLASARVLAQPAPAPAPAPTPTPPSPAPAPPLPPAPAPPPSPTPAPPAQQSPTPQPNTTPAPSPPQPTVNLPPEKPRTANEERFDAAAMCAAHSPDCDWLATFSKLERQSIARAMTARGLEVDPEPWGKVIGKVDVYNENVFAEKNWLQTFNFIHFTTREKAIRDELTIHAGELWDDDRVAESARVLRDPLFSSVVALLPVKSAQPGKVDLLVVTRDIWSLRFNTQYAFQQGSLTNLSMSISENNFLGHRNVVQAALLMDQGSLALGPVFLDKNFLGTHLYMSGRADTILTRQSLDVVAKDGTHTPTGDPKGLEDGGGFRKEGSDAKLNLSLPLWSLASEWGWGTSFIYSDAIARSYLGTGIRGYDDPSTPGIENIAREFRYRTWSVNGNGVRQWGSTLKQRLAVGYTLSGQHPSLLPNTTAGPAGDLGQQAIAADFIRDVFPHDEVISQAYVEYSFSTPRYRTMRNISTYELAEDVQLGPSLDVSVAESLSALGSTHTFTRPSLSIGWVFAVGEDGFVNPSASASLRIQPDGDGVHDTIDNSASALLRAATPSIGIGRIIGQVQVETLWHNTQNSYTAVGSDSGLRGYPINAFIGQRRFVAQLEARSTPFPLWIWRFGGVLFYEAGGADNSLDDMTIYHDVGVGIRGLIPQTSRELLRFDIALPLRPSPGNPVSPHFSAGFASYF